MLLASCRITDVSEGERKELSYAIVKPGDFPPEIDQILRKKKESAFQMAYESGDDLYILRGYGKQKSGGFRPRFSAAFSLIGLPPLYTSFRQESHTPAWGH